MLTNPKPKCCQKCRPKLCSKRHREDEIIDDNPPGPDVPDFLKIYCSPLDLNTESPFNIISSSEVLWYDNITSVEYKFHDDNKNIDKRTFFVENKEPFILNLNGTVFKLDEFHLHNLAENVIDGDRQSAEIHFVFEELIEGDAPDVNYAVLAFIFQEIEVGYSDPVVTSILTDTPLDIPDITDSKYFTFSGALTKPNFIDVPQVAVAWNVSTQYLNITGPDLQSLRLKYSRRSAETQPSNARNICLIDVNSE